MDELLDLVDFNDQIIGTKLRSEVYAQNLNNFRVVNLFLSNDQNQLWIPRRTASKKLFPLSLDTSMGGHVSSGESYEEALKRELQEELGIEAKEWIDLGLVYFRTDNINTPAYLFLAQKLTFIQAHPEASEIITPVKISLKKAIEMVMKSQIVHAPSCVLILKAKEYLKK